MKRFCLLFCLLASIPLFAASPRNPVADGTCKGIKLCGYVRVVKDQSADFTVRVVKGIADLDVEVVKGIASKCGEWEFVTKAGREDFTIRYTTKGDEDFTIRFVKSFPGVR